jgi:hypothetical protein
MDHERLEPEFGHGIDDGLVRIQVRIPPRSNGLPSRGVQMPDPVLRKVEHYGFERGVVHAQPYRRGNGAYRGFRMRIAESFPASSALLDLSKTEPATNYVYREGVVDQRVSGARGTSRPPAASGWGPDELSRSSSLDHSFFDWATEFGVTDPYGRGWQVLQRATFEPDSRSYFCRRTDSKGGVNLWSPVLPRGWIL